MVRCRVRSRRSTRTARNSWDANLSSSGLNITKPSMVRPRLTPSILRLLRPAPEIIATSRRPQLHIKTGESVSKRASSLADRIEEGAATLAAFAEGLSETEWRTPVSATDRRSIGIIVHHVATVYPVEIDLARAIAGGKAVSEVTWEVVAQLNARHAQEQAEVTKADALELLRRNSREGADAVRAFT